MNRLKELRLQAGLSQFQLAQAAETTQRNISYWESGRIEISLNAAIKLAQVLQVNVEYLAGFEDDFGTKQADNANALPAYSKEEQKLIEDYRALNYSEKKLVKQTVETLKSTSVQGEQNIKIN